MEYQHELIIPDEGLPFKLFLFEGAEGNYVREKHWHTSIEIFAVQEGTLSFYLNDREYPLKKGELMLINSNEIHSIHAPQKNKTVVLQIPLKQFESYFTAPHFIRFSGSGGDGNQALHKRIGRLYKIYAERGIGFEFRARSVYYEILYILVNDYLVAEAGEKEIRYNRSLEKLSKITGYMREHYTEDLRLSEIAAAFGYSEAYLSRLFRKCAKVNFKTYLQDIRMAYAYRDLLNTGNTISRVALDNGFCSSRSFSREFEKRYGILPSEVLAKQKGQKNAIE